MTHAPSKGTWGHFCILLVLAAACTYGDDNWPQFRGPDARGVAENPLLPDEWSATENVAWKTDIPGRGWSSPIVWRDRVFLTTVVSLGGLEEPKKGLYLGGNRPDAPDSVQQWKVFCLDLQSGEILWEKQVREDKAPAPIHLKNSYASETPVTDGERVYAYFGNVGIFCLDFEGNEVWTKTVPAHKTKLGWGTGASPTLHDGRLYIVNDNEDDSYIAAYAAETGEVVWRVAREEDTNWATPFVWENSLRTEIVTAASGKVRSYDLAGNALWSLAGMSGNTIATPYAAHGLVYISSGYVHDRLRPVYAIRPGATGDISLGEGETSNTWIAWCQPKAAPYNPTTLVYQDRLYVLHDVGRLACYDAVTGEAIYEGEKIAGCRRVTASPWAYNGNVFCLNEDGVTFVVKAGDTFEIMHSNGLAEDDMCLATPALAGDRLLIRSSARLYCIHGAG